MNDNLKLTVTVSKETALRLALEAHEQDMSLTDYLRRVLHNRRKDNVEAETETKVETPKTDVQEGSLSHRGPGLGGIERLRA